ncbi:zinc-binding dehydrogenase [Sagittula sp. SSi028]|uniref:zinc-binding dehydrogenase n=1 Tax=Sagittula sp. SSi028 TaxID=3400636 RepID=UPI003AF5C877
MKDTPTDTMTCGVCLEPGRFGLEQRARPIGIGTALFARIAGAEVHMMDLSPDRLATVSRLFGFDVVFDATGNAKAIEAGFALVAHGGVSVLVSVVKDHITFADTEFHKRESQIIGSRNALRADFDHVMTAMRAGQIPTDALLSDVMPLADLPARFAAIATDRSHLVKVLVTP